MLKNGVVFGYGDLLPGDLVNGDDYIVIGVKNTKHTEPVTNEIVDQAEITYKVIKPYGSEYCGNRTGDVSTMIHDPDQSIGDSITRDGITYEAPRFKERSSILRGYDRYHDGVPASRELLIRALENWCDLTQKDAKFEGPTDQRKDRNLINRVRKLITGGFNVPTIVHSQKSLLKSILSMHENMFQFTARRGDIQERWYPNTYGKHECIFSNEEMRQLRCLGDSL